MNPAGALAAALDRGDDPDGLGAAAHEIGHGIAFHAAGIRVRHMRVQPHRGKLGWRGDTEPVTHSTITSTAALHGFQVVLLAGEAAANRFCRLHVGLSAREAREVAESSARHDHDAFTRLAGPRLSLAEARSRAAALVDRHGTRIDRLTLRLVERRRLPGSVL